MQRSLAVALTGTLLLFAVLLGNAVSAEPAKQPNIVVFLVDDMGWQDTSVPFHTERTPLNDRYHTPNMERLAASGMKFTQAYATCVCSPSRVSLLTGLNAARHRVTNWTLRKNVMTDRPQPNMKYPEWNVNGMSPTPDVERTVHARPLPAYLQEAGYRTIHCGKAHFGAIGTPGADPKNLGFDVNIGGHAAGGPGGYLGEKNFGNAKAGIVTPPWGVPGLEAYHGKDIFLTEALTLEANKAVDQAVQDGKPFFLYMAHYAVHVPYAPDERFMKKYLDAGLDKTEAMYAALVEGMDKSLGDILDQLEKLKVADNTIVMFMSDNGGLSAHERGGPRHRHNAPLHSGKGSAYEGGIRVPMIVRWPGTTNPNSTCNTPVIIEDYFPTILELGGVTKPQQIGGVIDGVSFTSLLRGEAPLLAKRAFYWHYPNNWGISGPGIGATSTIRDGDWKLIYYHANSRYELFNLKDDLGEKQNLAEKQPELTAMLAKKLGAHLKDVNAQMPVFQNGTPVPLPGSAAIKLSRVLLIGDSISIGYTPAVKTMLAGIAEVRHNYGNAESTKFGLQQLDKWLGEEKWDVIHFNWGLHDLKYVDAQGKNTTTDQGKQRVSLEDYEKNLQELVSRLKKTNAKLIWASTTPVPEGAASRIAGDEIKYNQVAEKVMRENGVTINELGKYAAESVPTLPMDVHYNVSGYQKLGSKVADSIKAALSSLE